MMKAPLLPRLHSCMSSNGVHCNAPVYSPYLIYSPATKFAAIEGVTWAQTDDVRPIAEFKQGGVLLCELAEDECEWR